MNSSTVGADPAATETDQSGTGQSRRRGRPPAGQTPRWKVLYDAMAALGVGGLIRYEEMGELLGLDFLDLRDLQAIHVSARKAANELRRQQRTVLQIVRGHGYQVAEPSQVIDLARRHQARAVAEVQAGADKVDAIDLSRVDVTTARLIEATAMGFARQAVIMRQLDVRQDRLETAMTAVTITAQTAISRVEETSTRVDATQDDVQRLRHRVAELEARQPGRHLPADSLHPAGV